MYYLYKLLFVNHSSIYSILSGLTGFDCFFQLNHIVCMPTAWAPAISVLNLETRWKSVALVFSLTLRWLLYFIIPSQGPNRNCILPINRLILAMTVYPNEAPKPSIMKIMPRFATGFKMPFLSFEKKK